MNQIQLEAFFSELEEIEKAAGIFSRMGRGVKEKVIPWLQRQGGELKKQWKSELGELAETGRHLKRQTQIARGKIKTNPYASLAR